ncbi:hypothetical protein OG244_21605 [Streptomyces brevispora]|uniref:hypothetical protein n=1 Tax=Streptomyces brevispora TaxID=887462 RepID=UPI002E35C8AF|nr:hypothetical protein [Streptomyces brevispora]
MKHAVLRSCADWTSYDGIPRDDFALDSEAASIAFTLQSEHVPAFFATNRCR